jgi:hypothetical protein
MVQPRLTAAAAVLWALLSVGAVSAQGGPYTVAPHDFICLRLENRQRESGRVVAISGDSLWLEPSPNRRSAFGRNEVLVLQRRLHASGLGRGALIGGGVGIGVGFLPLALGCSTCDFDVGKFALLAAGVLGSAGALLGAGIGSITAPADWVDSAWPQRSGHGHGSVLSLTVTLRY